MTLPTLIGPRLTLRRLTHHDAGDLLNSRGDAGVMAFMARQPLADRTAARRFIDQVHDGEARGVLWQWGIEHDGEVVGTVTLAGIDRENRRAEIGFALAPARHRQGLMREALTAVLEHAFGPLGLHRVEADVDPGNAASLGLLEGLGFRREGTLRERHFFNSEIQDSVMLGLLAPEWRGRGPFGRR